MRTVTRNKRQLKYALNVGSEERYKRDSLGNIVYVTVDGTQVPVKTGERRQLYSEPKSFVASLSMSGGDVDIQEFGLSLADYNATILYLKGSIPITETSLIWADSEVEYTTDEYGDLVVDGKSADYSVLKISDTQNYSRAILKRVLK